MNIEYTDTIKPRISDINYGGHVGHIELISLLHEIRVRFLNKYSLNEININGHVLIMRNLNLAYKSQIYWNNELEIKMQMKIDRAKIMFDYRVFNTTLRYKAATAEATMVLVDKEKGKPAKPEIFIRMFKNDNNNEGKQQL